MDNYTKIITLLNANKTAQMNFPDGKIQLASSIRKDGSIRFSARHNKIEGAYDTGGALLHYKEYINDMDIKSITVYERPLWYPKVGEKVVDREGNIYIAGRVINGACEVFDIGEYSKMKDIRLLSPYLGEDEVVNQLTIEERVEKLEKALYSKE